MKTMIKETAMMTKDMTAYEEIGYVAQPLVGRIDYVDVNNNNKIYDSTTYTDADQFMQDVHDELTWYVDIIVTLFKNANGRPMSQKFMKGLNHEPVEIRIEKACTEVVL